MMHMHREIYEICASAWSETHSWNIPLKQQGAKTEIHLVPQQDL